MMPIIIILLGAVQGMYPSDSVFLPEVSKIFGDGNMVSFSEGGSFGDIFNYAGYTIIFGLYDIGESRPEFMLGLCVLATLILFYLTIYKHFIKGVPPLSFIDNTTDEEAIKREKERNGEENEDKIAEDKISEKEPIEILPTLLEVL